MQSRRDQVQAHAFVTGRLVSAMVRADPDAPETPTRRAVTGAFAGAMVAVIALAVFGMLGVLRPGGSTAWREAGAIIVEKETGSRFLLVDGVLRPVMNLASARLLAGAEAPVRSVSGKSLVGVPHGAAVGIPGAPDALPDPARLSYGPWLICSPADPDPAGAGPGRQVVTVAVGAPAGTAPLPADRALLVSTPGGSTYLAWGSRRLRIADRAALLALGYGTAQPTLVAEAWVNALPAGPDLRSQAVPGRGGRGPDVDGGPSVVGQVLLVPGTGSDAGDYYLVRQDGLAALTATDALLLLGDPANAAAYPGGRVRAIPVGAAAVAAAPQSPADSVTAGYPPEPPRLADGQGGQRVPCVRAVFRSVTAVDLQVALADPAAVPAPAGGAAPAPGADSRAADVVRVPPGGGLLVQDVPAPGITGGAVYLVTDLGLKYPLPTADAADALGYSSVPAVPAPSAILAFLPTGPALDQQAAKISQQTA